MLLHRHGREAHQRGLRPVPRPLAAVSEQPAEADAEQAAEDEQRKSGQGAGAQERGNTLGRRLPIGEGVEEPGDLSADSLRGRCGPERLDIPLPEAPLELCQPAAIRTGGEMALHGEGLLLRKLPVHVLEELRACDLTDHRRSWI